MEQQQNINVVWACLEFFFFLSSSSSFFVFTMKLYIDTIAHNLEARIDDTKSWEFKAK